MKIQEIINTIQHDKACKVVKRVTPFRSDIELPADLQYFYENYESMELFIEKPFGLRIVPYSKFIPILKETYPEKLYPADDSIWEDFQGDICHEWFVIAESEEMGQYISIDMKEPCVGYCYDTPYEAPAQPGMNIIIAKSFTELLEQIYKSKCDGETWFWLDNNFQSYGDAYDDR